MQDFFFKFAYFKNNDKKTHFCFGNKILILLKITVGIKNTGKTRQC
jgi:hypothetical protein